LYKGAVAPFFIAAAKLRSSAVLSSQKRPVSGYAEKEYGIGSSGRVCRIAWNNHYQKIIYLVFTFFSFLLVENQAQFRQQIIIKYM
jgi:hypothetical protein